jgi:glycosyltransferase involved in cell wall biosynthesis
MVRTLGPGGTERQAVEIAKALNRARFAPHVACFEAGGFGAQQLRRNHIPMLELPLHSLLSPSYLTSARLLRAYLREHSIRLVHSFDFPTAIFGVPLCRLEGGLRVLASQRGHRETFPPKYRKLLKIADLLAHGYVANCEAMRRHLIEDCGIPERKVRVCYNGVNLACFAPSTFESSGNSVIGTVGLLRPEKGIEILLDAAAAIRKRHSAVRLRIVGAGPLLSSLRERSRRLFGTTNTCTFEPATDHVAACLHQLDIFVLPSRSEAFPNSLMEAMACGCAVVASRTGGIPELVQDGTTGLLFTPGDVSDLAAKLELLLEDHATRRRLAEAGQTAVRSRFSIEASAQCMEQIYEEFLTLPVPLQ